MRLRAILSAAVLPVACACGGAPRLPGSVAKPAGHRPPVVLVSVDALRPTYLHRADAHGLRIPTLRGMLRDGSAASSVRGVLPTVTYPTHTTMLTGVSPNRHGILANTTFDPLDRNQGGWHWYAEDVAVPTLWQAVRDAGLESASFYWPVNVGAKATTVLAEVWRADAADDRKLTRALSTPGLVDELEAAVGPLPGGHLWTVEEDEQRTRAAAYYLEKHRPALLTLHLLALDHAQHHGGPESAEAFAVLERLDTALGSLRAAARRSGQGDATFCVVSDHGFRSVARRVNLLGELVREGLVDRARGTWEASVWVAGGTGAVRLRDPNDADVHARVEKLLGRLAGDESVGIERILSPAEARTLGGFGDASFVIAMKPGTMLDSSWDGPLVSDVPESVQGTHGYLPDDVEMSASFVCEGAGIARASLGRVDMRDVAPSLAGLLGVRLPLAEGRELFGSTPAQ